MIVIREKGASLTLHQAIDVIALSVRWLSALGYVKAFVVCMKFSTTYVRKPPTASEQLRDFGYAVDAKDLLTGYMDCLGHVMYPDQFAVSQ